MQDTFEDFLRITAEKGCNTACCGIDAFHRQKDVLRIFQILAGDPDDLAGRLKTLPAASSADIVGSLEVLSDIIFLSGYCQLTDDQEHNRLLAAVNDLTRQLERELALKRRGNR